MHNHAKYIVYLCLVSSLCADTPLISEELKALTIKQDTDLMDNNADALSQEAKENLYTSYDIVKDNIPSLKTIAIGAGTLLTSRKLYGLLNEYIKSEDIAVEKPDPLSEYTAKNFITTVLSGVAIRFSVLLAKRKIEQKNLNEIGEEFKKLKTQYKAIKENPDESYVEQLQTILAKLKVLTMSVQGTAKRSELSKAEVYLVHWLEIHCNTIKIDLDETKAKS